MEYGFTLSRNGAMGAFPKWLTFSGAIGVCCILGGVVLAEQGGSVIPDATVEMEQHADLSPAEQTAWAEEQLEEMQSLSRRIQRMLDQARQERDIIKIGCLNNKLTELNATIRSFESVGGRHGDAVSSRNAERRNHHFRILVILAERARSMRVEADGCVGGPDVVFGRTEVTTEVDPSITSDDTTELPIDDFVFDRPASASGYY